MSKLLKAMEEVALEVLGRVKKRRNGPSPDMLKGMAAYIGSYRKQYELENPGSSGRKRKLTQQELLERGDPSYHELLEEE